MFIGSCNGIFRALDNTTGRLRWETTVSPDAVQYFFHGNPLITADVIVIGADRASGANIHAFHRTTGKELWRHDVGRGVRGPIAGDGRRAYASTIDGRLLSLDTRSGDVKWIRELTLPAWEGPTLAGDRLFAATVDGSLHALNPDSGRDEWTSKLPAPATTSVLATADNLYIGTSDRSIHQLDARSGKLVASRPLDDLLVPVSVPVRVKDSIIVLLQDKSGDYRAAVALDPALQGIRWRTAAQPNWSTSRVFPWGDTVVVGSPTGEIAAYCAGTGKPAWSRTIKGRARAVGGAGDTLVVGTPAGDLYALRAPRSCDAK